MDNICGMRGGQRSGNLDGYVQDLRRFQIRFKDHFAQRFAFDIFADNVIRLIADAYLVNDENVRMI